MFKVLSRLFFLQNILSYLVCKLLSPVLVHNLSKYFALKKAFYLVNLEELEGDYIEFGVFTGSSFVAAMNSTYLGFTRQIERKFVGFDSFEGFGELDAEDMHPFYKNLNFQTDYNSVFKRVKKIAKKRKVDFMLVKGFFDDTCVGKKPIDYELRKMAVCLIDCDTYQGAIAALDFITPMIQQGSILILDDFFSYRGRQDRGMYRALVSWKEKNGISLRKLSDYGMGGVIFVLGEKSV